MSEQSDADQKGESLSRHVFDWHTRVLGYVGVAISALSLVFAGYTVHISQSNRDDAEEQLVIRFSRSEAESELFSLPIDSFVSSDRKVFVGARRKTWSVLVANTSTTTEATVVGIWPGQRHVEEEAVLSQLNELRLKLIEPPSMPFRLGPSKTISLTLSADTPVASNHVPMIIVRSSRGRQYLGVAAKN